MTEDKIKKLLQDADQMAGRPELVSVDPSAIYHRARHKRFVNMVIPVTAAAVVLIAVGIWSLAINFGEKVDEQQKIVSLETQIKQLQARSDASLKFIQEVIENERRQQRLDELQAELASIPDALEEIQKQVDKTAFILVYQADRMYRELNLKNSAVKTYKRVIELFPQTSSAEAARQRLSEIESRKHKNDSKGDLLWKPQSVPSSC